MTFEDFLASRQVGISNNYYAGGVLCIHMLPDGVCATIIDDNEYQGTEYQGTLEECEAMLFAYRGQDIEPVPAWGFNPDIYIAGKGTKYGMSDLLIDYCNHYGFTPASADEMAVNPDIEPEHRAWFVRFGEVWEDILGPQDDEPSQPAPDMSIRTIDVTPTWSSILHTLLTLYENSNSEGRATAVAELKRMAAIADKFVTAYKG